MVKPKLFIAFILTLLSYLIINHLREKCLFFCNQPLISEVSIQSTNEIAYNGNVITNNGYINSKLKPNLNNSLGKGNPVRYTLESDAISSYQNQFEQSRDSYPVIEDNQQGELPTPPADYPDQPQVDNTDPNSSNYEIQGLEQNNQLNEFEFVPSGGEYVEIMDAESEKGADSGEFDPQNGSSDSDSGFSLSGGIITNTNNQIKEESDGNDDKTTKEGSPPRTETKKIIESLSIGETHTCLISSGRVYCSGSNGSSESGQNKGIESIKKFSYVKDLDGATLVSSGGKTTCVLTSKKTVYCFGDSANGKLNVNGESYLADASGTALSNITSMSVGKTHSCVSNYSGEVFCWGTNDFGQIGHPPNSENNFTQKIPSEERFKKVLVGNSFSCALSFNKKLFCWGLNQYGKLGINSSANKHEPTEVAEIENVVDFALGEDHACAISRDESDYKLFCWGSNNHKQLLSYEEPSARKPILLSINKHLEIESSKNTICAIESAGLGSCWGDIGFGIEETQLDTISNYPGLESVSKFYGGPSGFCFVKKSGDLYFFGENSSGQFADSEELIKTPKKLTTSGL